MGMREDWYFYTKNAVDYCWKNNIKSNKSNFVTKEKIYIEDDISYNKLCSEVSKTISKNLNITIPYDDEKDLTYAVFFDKYMFPDETIFVTENCDTAIAANLFFGEDSIINISEKEM